VAGSLPGRGSSAPGVAAAGLNESILPEDLRDRLFSHDRFVIPWAQARTNRTVVGVARAARPIFTAALTKISASEASDFSSAPEIGGSRLRRAVRGRLTAADREIPQLLDLLAAGATAGLAGQLALVRACSGLRGPLADEIEASLRAVELGRRWRDELVALVERLRLPDLRRVVAVLTRTEMLGTPLTESLIDLAADVRAARAAAASERARKAPVKMLFQLVFLVLPAFLLLTVVPVLLSTIRSLS